MELVCVLRPQPPVLVGEPYEFCATVRNVGTHVLEEIQLRMQVCSGSVLAEGAVLEVVVPVLDVGESHTHCIQLASTIVGPCRLVAHAVDNTGIAASGCYCVQQIEGLPALQLEMIDLDLAGEPQGVFRIGEEFIYFLRVEEDAGSASTGALKVRWTLPPELEFVRGSGRNVTTVVGEGQSCESSIFDLPPGAIQELQIVCKVIDVPERYLVQTRAEVITADGEQLLAEETESTTLRR
jgi:hypothetical protein